LCHDDANAPQLSHGDANADESERAKDCGEWLFCEYERARVYADARHYVYEQPFFGLLLD
jgi:hypothetical protein